MNAQVRRSKWVAKRAAPGRPVKACAPEVRSGDDAARFARRVLAACLDQIEPNARIIRSGRYEAEHVHQLRVGLRRLRTALGELAELNALIDVRWSPVLADAFRGLGRTRDRQVIQSSVRDELLAAGAPVLPELAWTDAPDAVQVARRSGLRMALRALDDLARSGDSPTAAAFPGGPLEALLPRLETLHRSLAKSAKRFTALSDAEQHRARKRLKRLRYLTEFVAPLFRRRLVRPYLTRLETAQLALGRLNDCTIALEAYLGLIQDEPGKWFAIGWLRSRRDALAQQAMDALVALRGAPRFW